jgi:NAD(P)-dependent dehydrogenase (short-subunit alcohol dehydrogenase family)
VKGIPAAYRPPPDLLRDRTIALTGAGDGLGRASALAAAGCGATVVLLGRTVPKLEQAYDAIKSAGGAEPAIYPINLAGAGWGDYATLAETLEKEFGALHGLLHCAAHFKGYTPLSGLDPRDWLETLQVNLTAPFALTSTCLPLLRKAGDASVVFVSDAAGRKGRAYAGAYGVGKFALEGLMQIWSEELGADSGVRFNSFDPGPMATALRRRSYVAGTADAARAPEAVAPEILWLLGADSRGRSGVAF